MALEWKDHPHGYESNMEGERVGLSVLYLGQNNWQWKAGLKHGYGAIFGDSCMSMQEAKSAAVAELRRVLTEALAELGDE